MELRPMTALDDRLAVGGVYAESWRHAYRGILPQAYLDGISGSRWERKLDDPALRSLLLLDGERVVGTSAVCAARPPAPAGWGEVVSLYLLPAYMGRGLGRQLLAEALETLRRMGFDRVSLWVLEENVRARRFYEAFGLRRGDAVLEDSIGGRPVRELQYCWYGHS